MTTPTTPGVYIQEISNLPPSVVQVATAVPAFIGYTAKGTPSKAIRITSMVEFVKVFGGANPATFSVSVSVESTVTGNPPPATINTVTSLSVTNTSSTNSFYLYYALRHFYDNGGGACYIVSIGDYSSTPAASAFINALTLIDKEEEPTLLVFPDALALDQTPYYDFVKKALSSCATLQDRFTIIDLNPGTTPVDADFTTGNTIRPMLGMENLDYGALYTPWLESTYPYVYEESDVTVNSVTAEGMGSATLVISAANGVNIVVIYSGSKPASGPTATIKETSTTASENTITVASNVLTINVKKSSGSTVEDVIKAWAAVSETARGPFELQFWGNPNTNIDASSDISPTGDGEWKFPASLSLKLDELKNSRTLFTQLYNKIITLLGEQYITLPSSGAMAGIYAQTDRTRGVWKAPANVSVASIVGPNVKITSKEQGLLNVDPNTGKSINAIRAFKGKGTLVWGARTLAGNDNNWRYINVRRLFITVEESVKLACGVFVFEPNDATTWLKVKAMIDNYLYSLWQQGALVGLKPAAAYFVHVGLGKTMTDENILNGEMIVDVGIAASRPAEFIILKFSQKMQEA